MRRSCTDYKSPLRKQVYNAKLLQLQLDNCGLPFLFLSKRGKPIAMNIAMKIDF
jgi:hypothetical protein